MVAVGDSARVELIFNAGARRGGKVVKKATVTTNDNTRGNFQLGFTGEIYAEQDSSKLINLSETALEFNPETHDDKVKIKVLNQSDQNLKMKLVAEPYGYLDIKVDDGEIKPGKDKDIEVKIDKNCDKENFKKSFTIELNDKDKTRYTIPVELRKVMMSQPPTPGQSHTVVKKGQKPSTEEGK